MATVQLNVRVEAGIAAALKAEAKRRYAAPGALVTQAIEQFLANDGRPLANATAQQGGQWQKEVERRLAALEAKAKPAPAAPPPPAPKVPLSAAPAIPQTGEVLTTAELAEATSTNRSAWNNWARDKNPGAIRKMKPEVGNWRYLGKAASEMGGPDRGLWERA